MRTAPRIALRSLVALLELVLGLLLYVLYLGDLSVHKDRILRAASETTGFYIASEGPFDLDVGREISLSVDNASAGFQSTSSMAVKSGESLISGL